jgi:hypothetical protein
VATRRLRRFLHIERPRGPGDPAPDEPSDATAGRFEGLGRPPGGPGPRPAASGVRLERFGPDPEPSVELAETDPEARPFTRCMRCGAESGAFATRCSGCDADLDTPAQHEFNEKLWARRQEDRRREESALAERRETMARAAAEEARARREMGESLAREVGELERRRLEIEEARTGGWRGGWGGALGRDPTPVGLRLLRWIANPWVRLGVILGAMAVPAVLLAIPGARQAGVVVLVVLLSLLAPAGWRRRRWRRW